MSLLNSPNKTVIITGGNSGLGYQCAKTLASANDQWHIVIASRDPMRTSTAVEQLRRETAYPAIDALPLDLGSLDSIRTFEASLQACDWPPLHAIVCNAGTQSMQGITYTQDGFETTFGVNHLGHFLLVNLLLRHLVAPARIVFVSSGTHDPETLDGRFAPPQYHNARLLALPDEAAPLSGMRRYTTSKLCNILCAYELHRRLHTEGYHTADCPITVNAYDPGPVPGTNLIRDWNPIVRRLVKSPLLRWFGVHISDVETSGAAMAHLILDPELAHVSNKYFQVSRERSSSKESYNEATAKELWHTSAELVKLQPNETILRVV